MKKIVLTGPESSGKTTLAQTFSTQYNVAYTPEFARSYLSGLTRAYERDDLRFIGAGQRAWENWRSLQDPPFLICDTDWTVLQIWEQYRFVGRDKARNARERYQWEEGYGPPLPADLYLLCYPDIPWELDPLREHPEERSALYDLYFQLLSDTGSRFVVLKGTLERRMKEGKQAIDSLF